MNKIMNACDNVYTYAYIHHSLYRLYLCFLHFRVAIWIIDFVMGVTRQNDRLYFSSFVFVRCKYMFAMNIPGKLVLSLSET